MTRVAVIPTLTDGKAGLWSVARSEGRIPLNWGALLAANGYEVYVIAQWPDFADCSMPNVAFTGPDECPPVDFVLHASTARYGSIWFGRGTVNARHVIRLQWPTGGPIDASGDLVAIADECVREQVASEAARSPESLFGLPSPVLPLDWWERARGLPASPFPERNRIMWAARDVFAGSSEPFGRALLAAAEWVAVFKGLRPFVLSIEQHGAAHGRFNDLGATMTSQLHLGGVLAAMRQCVLAFTGPYIMGPTLYEATFEGCAPLVWGRYGALFPRLVDAAHKHGVLLKSERDVEETVRRLIDDWGMRAAYVDSCRFAFADHSPAKAMESWRAMEARVG